MKCVLNKTEQGVAKDVPPVESPRAVAAEFLFDLLDEIDTASDIAKHSDALYRHMVERIQRRRFEVADVDAAGQKVIFKFRQK